MEVGVGFEEFRKGFNSNNQSLPINISDWDKGAVVEASEKYPMLFAVNKDLREMGEKYAIPNCDTIICNGFLAIASENPMVLMRTSFYSDFVKYVGTDMIPEMVYKELMSTQDDRILAKYLLKQNEFEGLIELLPDHEQKMVVENLLCNDRTFVNYRNDNKGMWFYEYAEERLRPEDIKDVINYHAEKCPFNVLIDSSYMSFMKDHLSAEELKDVVIKCYLSEDSNRRKNGIDMHFNDIVLLRLRNICPKEAPAMIKNRYDMLDDDDKAYIAKRLSSIGIL